MKASEVCELAKKFDPMRDYFLDLFESFREASRIGKSDFTMTEDWSQYFGRYSKMTPEQQAYLESLGYRIEWSKHPTYEVCDSKLKKFLGIFPYYSDVWRPARVLKISACCGETK